jgi:hypothetical protein
LEFFCCSLLKNQQDEWLGGNSGDAQGVIVELVWRSLHGATGYHSELRRAHHLMLTFSSETFPSLIVTFP